MPRPTPHELRLARAGGEGEDAEGVVGAGRDDEVEAIHGDERSDGGAVGVEGGGGELAGGEIPHAQPPGIVGGDTDAVCGLSWKGGVVEEGGI